MFLVGDVFGELKVFVFGRAHSGCVEEAGERASDEAGDDVLAGKLAITLAMILTTRRQGEGRRRKNTSWMLT